MSSQPEDVTQLLIAWSQGDRDSADRLMPLIYDELRRLAARHLAGERPEHTFQPTALVNEAYLRLIDLRHVKWQNRAHFFAMAAQAMRRLLVDHARRQRSAKRGGADRGLPLDQVSELAAAGRAPDLMALDEALKNLATFDPLKASIVELRFFGGLSNKEAGEVLECSRATVGRHWQMAKAWLHGELSEPSSDDA